MYLWSVHALILLYGMEPTVYCRCEDVGQSQGEMESSCGKQSHSALGPNTSDWQFNAGFTRLSRHILLGRDINSWFFIAFQWRPWLFFATSLPTVSRSLPKYRQNLYVSWLNVKTENVFTLLSTNWNIFFTHLKQKDYSTSFNDTN